jgi:ATP-dependent Clp protease ATP-binding subunit ClpC
MPTYRYPVLVWEDHAGNFTAAFVEDEEAPAAFASTPEAALYQLKEYLDWTFHQYPWQSGPEVSEARLMHFRVEVRPEYKTENRVYPCEELFVLRLPVVYGKHSRDAWFCSIPTLNVRFIFHDPQKLKDLVNHYAGETLRGNTPQRLSRFLQPRDARLEDVVIHVHRKDSSLTFKPDLKTLDSVAEALGEKKSRRQLARAWEREAEVAGLVHRLAREKANVILVGESGAGKSAVLIEAIRQIERTQQEEDDESRREFKFWMTSGARLIAGMQYLGEWQARCEQVIAELSNIGGVLCFENLFELMHTGTGGPDAGLAVYFTPYLQRGEMRMVAEATPAELDACRKALPGFIDLFQILKLPDFDRTQAVKVLERIAANHARNLKLTIAGDVSATIYRLFRRFRPYDAFPGKSVAFLHQLADRAAREGTGAIKADDCIAQFIRQTGLPEIFLRDEWPLVYEQVLDEFGRQVIGQDGACEAAAHLVTTFKAGLNDANRPLGVLLFCGPTGVGKTELARALARYLFGHGETPVAEQRLVRLDLSEYADAGAARRLAIGPDGEPSELITRLRQQPFCVVLLDEIEKAHPAVFDLLLSVFDEGRLSDSLGRVTTFRSAVLVMTSNLGADKLDTMGFETRGGPTFSREAMNFFRPEFFNRIDSVVQFNSLSKEMMRRITAKELGEIAGREGFQKAGLKLEWTEETVERLIMTGFDQRYGARPLQRAIETQVVAPLAKYLLAHPEMRNQLLRISFDESGTLQIVTSH